MPQTSKPDRRVRNGRLPEAFDQGRNTTGGFSHIHHYPRREHKAVVTASERRVPAGPKGATNAIGMPVMLRKLLVAISRPFPAPSAISCSAVLAGIRTRPPNRPTVLYPVPAPMVNQYVPDVWGCLGTSAGNRSRQKRRAWIKTAINQSSRTGRGQVPGIPGIRRNDAYQGAFCVIHRSS